MSDTSLDQTQGSQCGGLPCVSLIERRASTIDLEQDLRPRMQQLMPYITAKRHIIWDWNGTLLNDTSLAVTSISRVLTSRGMPTIDEDHYRSVFGFPIRAYYERIGLKTDAESLARLSEEFHGYYDEAFDQCALHQGVLETLVEIKSRTLTQSILSAAQQNWLLRQLNHFKIHHHFDHVYGLTDFLANSKLERGRQLMDASGIDRAHTILIGDTDHDVEVAQELGIDVVIYADGHQAPSSFSRFDVPVLRRTPMHDS